MKNDLKRKLEGLELKGKNYQKKKPTIKRDGEEVEGG